MTPTRAATIAIAERIAEFVPDPVQRAATFRGLLDAEVIAPGPALLGAIEEAASEG